MRRTTAAAATLTAAILGGLALTGCGGAPEKLTINEARRSEAVMQPARDAVNAWGLVALEEDAPGFAWDNLESARAELGKAIAVAPEAVESPLRKMAAQIDSVISQRHEGGHVVPADFDSAVQDLKASLNKPDAFENYDKVYEAWTTEKKVEELKRSMRDGTVTGDQLTDLMDDLKRGK